MLFTSFDGRFVIAGVTFFVTFSFLFNSFTSGFLYSLNSNTKLISCVPSFSPQVKRSIVHSIFTCVFVIISRKTPLFFMVSIIFTHSLGLGNVVYSQKSYFCFGKNEEKEIFFSFLFPSRFISPNELITTCVLLLSLVTSYSCGRTANLKLVSSCFSQISNFLAPLCHYTPVLNAIFFNLYASASAIRSISLSLRTSILSANF